MRKVGIISLGCVKNLVDAELMLGDLASHELTITPDPEEADIIIVNTCGFIESAQQESVDTILQMAEYKNANCKMLLVSGCLAQRFATELVTEIPEIDAIIGTGSWQKIREAIERVDSGEKPVMILDELTNLYTEDMPRVLTTPSYTAYIKVAEGCSNRCAYCVIPSVRGDFRSRGIGAQVRHVQGEDFIHVPTPHFHCLPRKAVHQIKADVAISRLTQQGHRPVCLLRGVTPETFQMLRLYFLHM